MLARAGRSGLRGAPLAGSHMSPVMQQGGGSVDGIQGYVDIPLVEHALPPGKTNTDRILPRRPPPRHAFRRRRLRSKRYGDFVLYYPFLGRTLDGVFFDNSCVLSTVDRRELGKRDCSRHTVQQEGRGLQELSRVAGRFPRRKGVGHTRARPPVVSMLLHVSVSVLVYYLEFGE